MIISADWVVPVVSPPVRDGAVLVRGNRILEVGTRAALEAAAPEEPVVELAGCTLMPGLVNAHTHLALSVLADIVPSAPFPEWIARTARAMRELTPDDLAASAMLGAHRCISSGTTAVGDIVYAPETPDIARNAGLAGTFFWEVLGTTPDALADGLAADGFPADPASHATRRVRYTVSAHAPYTTGPGLIGALHAVAGPLGGGMAVHLAESPAEVEFVHDGTGPLASIASRTAPDFSATGTSPVCYLDELGALDDSLAIHCAEARDGDVAVLAEKARAVVVCPRSNAYLHVGPAPVEALDRAGARLALGTDSLASTPDLDLFAEARALQAVAPSLTPEHIVRMMTVGGAAALGLADTIGAIAPGFDADLAAFRTPANDDPYATLLETAGRPSIEAVMSAGMWHVRGGAPTSAIRFVSMAVKRASVRAAAAIA